MLERKVLNMWQPCQQPDLKQLFATRVKVRKVQGSKWKVNKIEPQKKLTKE
jgi:hypothetical protein